MMCPMKQRLLAHVMGAVYGGGNQHVVSVRCTDVAVLVTFAASRWLAQQVNGLVAALVGARIVSRAPRDLALDPDACVEIPFAGQSAEAMAAAPRVDGLAWALSRALDKQLATLGVRDVLRILGSTRPDGLGDILVQGGFDDGPMGINTRATAWSMLWIRRHFPEFTVETGCNAVSRLTVWHVDRGTVVRALRLTEQARAERAA